VTAMDGGNADFAGAKNLPTSPRLYIFYLAKPLRKKLVLKNFPVFSASPRDKFLLIFFAPLH
jgi:hypothetical protein